METPESRPVFFYRYRDCPEEGACQHSIRLDKFRLLRISDSGKTGWIKHVESHFLTEPRRIKLNAHRPWAHATIKAAWEAYRHRKHWQVSLLADQLARARACFALVDEAIQRHSSPPGVVLFDCHDGPFPPEIHLCTLASSHFTSKP
jgi:hypothetical protein